MIPTPTQVLPLVECTIAPLAKALRLGSGLASELQPDPDNRDSHFWSHTARWCAKRDLFTVDKQGWELVENVANSGIHLRVGGLHRIRVLKSLEGNVPSPGRNKVRRKAWVQSEFTLDVDDDLPALSLIADWQVVGDDPVISLSLPRRAWPYGSDPEVYWRVPVTGNAGEDLSKLQFDPGLLPGDVSVTIKIDPSEQDVG